MDNEEFLKTTEDFFAGVFSMIDDDMPDGAWFQAHVDAAEFAIDEVCEIFELKKPENIDGFDITHHYINANHTA